MTPGTWIFPVMGISLAVTLAAELLFAALCGIRDRKELLLVAAVNLLTNPAVVACYYLTAWRLWEIMEREQAASWLRAEKAVLELAAVAAEAAAYRGCSRKIRRPWLFSLMANISSCGVGAALQLCVREFGG